MAADPGLLARIDDILDGRPGLTRKRMFGGIGLLDHGNMFAAVGGDKMILRCGEDKAETLLRRRGFSPMDLTGKLMKGWVVAHDEALAEDEDLRDMILAALAVTRTLPAK